MFYGKGAGKLPTASAVVSDVVDCARHPGEHMTCIWEEEPVHLKPLKTESAAFLCALQRREKRKLMPFSGRWKDPFGGAARRIWLPDRTDDGTGILPKTEEGFRPYRPASRQGLKDMQKAMKEEAFR